MKLAPILFPTIALLTTASCDNETPDTSTSTAEAAAAKEALSQLQPISFSDNVEYCGYIIRNAAGEITPTPAARGDTGSCLGDEPPADAIILASYHTHGAFEIDTPAEFPSVQDVEGDEDEGIDGYVSTPGGRFWFVDSSELTVSQLCGIGCLPSDPAFVPGLDGEIAESYTLDELIRLEAM